MTHLYASDDSTGEATDAQLARLDESLAKIRTLLTEENAGHAWLNVGTSAALLGGESTAIAALAARHGLIPMLRPGLALYGIAPRYIRLTKWVTNLRH